jgi:hypothetical protein
MYGWVGGGGGFAPHLRRPLETRVANIDVGHFITEDAVRVVVEVAPVKRVVVIVEVQNCNATAPQRFFDTRSIVAIVAEDHVLIEHL